MPIVNYFLISAILFIGILVSYEDIKFGKIRNKWILIGLFIGIGVHLIGLASNVFSWDYIFKVCLNAGLALFLGYLIWHFNGWSAGDAKLFFVFSLLLPLKFYRQNYLPYFPSFVILINTFFPFLVFSIGQSLFLFFKKFFPCQGKQLIKEKLEKIKYGPKTSYSRYFKIIFGFFLFFLIFQIIRLEFGQYPNHFNWGMAALFFLIFALGGFLRKVFQKNYFLILIFLGIIFYLTLKYFLFSHQEILDEFFHLIRGSIFFLVIFGLVSYWVSFYVKVGEKKRLPFAIWLLLGVILTILCQGSLLRFIF